MKNNDSYTILDEAMGVFNTSGTAFNKLVQRVVEDTLEFPKVGTKINRDDVESIKYRNLEIDFHNVRRNFYNNTGLDWLPSLEVNWIKMYQPAECAGYALNDRPAIVIIVYDGFKDYEEVISHEIRHLHTNYIQNKFSPYKMRTEWRDKSVSVTQIESMLYSLSTNKNLL